MGGRADLAVGPQPRDGPVSRVHLDVPLIFASSVLAPPETMPGWLQPFVEVNPITVATDALRGLPLGGPVLSRVLRMLAWTAALTVVFAPLAIRQFRRLS